MHGTIDDSDSSRRRRAGGERSSPGAATGGGRGPANRDMAGKTLRRSLTTPSSSTPLVRLVTTPVAAVGVHCKGKGDRDVEGGDLRGERPGDGGDGTAAAARQSYGDSGGSTSLATTSSRGARGDNTVSRPCRNTPSTMSDSSSDGESRVGSAMVTAVREGMLLTPASAGKAHSQRRNRRKNSSGSISSNSSREEGDDRRKEHGDEEEKLSRRDPREWGANGEGRGGGTPQDESGREHLGA